MNNNVLEYLEMYKDKMSSLPESMVEEILIAYQKEKDEKNIISLMAEIKKDEYVHYIKDFDLKIKCLMAIDPRYIFFEMALVKQFTKDIPDDIKMKYFHLFTFEHELRNAILKLESDTNKIECLALLDDCYKSDVIRTINNDNLLLEYYEKCNSSRFTLAVSCKSDFIKEKALKEKVFREFSLYEQAQIITTFSNDLLKIKYAVMPQYSEYRSLLIDSISNIDSIGDKEFIIECFKRDKSIKFRLDVIKKTTDENLKKKLVSLLDESIYKSILNTNYNENLNNIKLDDINYDIDKDITIGLELEACNKSAYDILPLKKIFNKWEIEGEYSFYYGLEIVSPILHFDMEGIKEIFNVCEFMKANNFYTNTSCGGHIHLGFNYIKTVEQFKKFLNLYINIEDILYIISNKAGSKCRTSINKYARPIRKIMKSGIIDNINLEKITNLNDYITIVQKNQPTRYYGLNMQNIGDPCKNTLEFRIPNAEIEFKELISNIRLFAAILMVSKKITTAPSQKDIYLYNKIINGCLTSEQKLSTLLHLLPISNEEKEVYTERYNINCSINKTLVKQ